MNDLNERVLDSWLKLTSTINNDRLVPTLTYNEALVCHFVYLTNKRHTASSLCKETGILKSQMNRILKALEDKKLILRKRSAADKRDIYIEANHEKDTFIKQHEKILDIVDRITKRLGKDESEEVIRVFEEIAKIAKEEI